MANTTNGLLTTQALSVLAEIVYISTSVGASTAFAANAYAFIGKVDSWTDDNNPPVPQQSQSYIKQVAKNIVAAKQITTSSSSPVIPRYDWTSGDVYVPYTDYQNMFLFDGNGVMNNIFYVRNRYDQVFKCLGNNNGGDSFVEPVLKPGATDTTQVLYLSDGYKWIYMYTIDKGLKKSFFDAQWMPVYIGISTPNTLTAAKFGSIDVINVTANGSNYTDGTATTTVTIKGDGDGAAGYANASGGVISDVIMTNTGNNYTYATVTIATATTNGSGATANAIISPIGGHALDPITELGCNHIMLTAEFDNSESTVISSTLSSQPYLPTNISFRQVGLLITPIDNTGNAASLPVYNTCDYVGLSTGSGTYTSGEKVYQGSSYTTALNSGFVATVVSHDTTNNLVSLINTDGTYTLGQPLLGFTSGTSRVMLQYSPTLFNVGSGSLIYIENRSSVQRNANGNEQIRMVLRF
jgi:hypothetical protein